MADETTTETAQETAEEAGKNTAAATGEQTAAQESGAEAKFTQLDVDRIVANRIAEEKARHQRAVEEGKAAAEKKRLAEQGEWQKLYEEQKDENDRLAAEVAQKEREALCVRIAAKHKLPETLAARLQGDSEAEIEADAAEIAKTVAPPKPPDLDMRGANGTAKTLTLDDAKADARKHRSFGF